MRVGEYIRMTVGIGLGVAVTVDVGISNDVAISTTWLACILAYIFIKCIFPGVRHEKEIYCAVQSIEQTGRSLVFIKGIFGAVG